MVEERADLPLRPAGEFRVYSLMKSGWTTPGLIREIARTAGLPFDLFSYGGKKDKHGQTTQFIAVRDVRNLEGRGADFSLRAVGFMDRPMGPDLIRENDFIIIVRDLAETRTFEGNIEEVRRSGFPNFFDDQRFRSYDPERGFFAEKIVRRHWNGALQVYLTSADASASDPERARLAAVAAAWKDWPACLGLARHPLEQAVFGHLAAHPSDARGALRLIPEDEVSMRYAAFQSHLWNELLRRLIRGKAAAVTAVEGSCGPYLFWRELAPEIRRDLEAVELPTAAARMAFGDDFSAGLYADILREAGLEKGAFRTKELRRVGFRSFLRKALLFPLDLIVRETGADDLHPGRRKITLSFSLPRGAYGTMLIKRLSL